MGDTLEGPLLWAYDRSHCLAFQGEDQFLLAFVALILPTLRLCGLYGRRRYRQPLSALGQRRQSEVEMKSGAFAPL